MSNEGKADITKLGELLEERDCLLTIVFVTKDVVQGVLQDFQIQNLV